MSSSLDVEGNMTSREITSPGGIWPTIGEALERTTEFAWKIASELMDNSTQMSIGSMNVSGLVQNVSELAMMKTAEMMSAYNTTWQTEDLTQAMTTANVSGTSGPSLQGGDDHPLWLVIIEWVQFAFTTIGFFLNMLTLITLMKNCDGFGRATLILFRHQSLADAWVCLIASIVILQPFMWLTGIYVLDVFICHAWHGQAFYWGSVTLSTYNLVLIAYERYLSIHYPFKYTNLENISKKRIAGYMFGLYLFTLFITHGTYIQTRLKDGECVNEYAFNNMGTYFSVFVVFTYITTYVGPLLVMTVLYSSIAYALRKRGNDTTLGHSRLIDRASSDLTKTAFVVTIIFAISIGYDLHYYLLGYTGVVTYELNTPIQTAGVFLSNLNSCANPVVYALLMPLYRSSVMKTLTCKSSRRVQKEVSSVSLKSRSSSNFDDVSGVSNITGKIENPSSLHQSRTTLVSASSVSIATNPAC